MLTKRLQANILDMDFEAMLYPLHLMQQITLHAKYRVVNGFIVRRGYLSSMLCVLGMCLNVFLHVSKVIDQIHMSPTGSTTIIVFSLAIFDAVFYISIILTMFIENLINCQTSMELVMKMNKIYRCLDGYTTMKDWGNYNWFWFYFIFGLYTFFFIYNILMVKVSYLIIFCNMTIICLDVNIIFATRVIKFLTLEVKSWEQEMKEFRASSSDTGDEHLKRYLESRGRMLCHTYVDILQAFKHLEKLFHRTIFLFTADIFRHTLSTIQTFIQLSKSNDSVRKSTTNSALSGFVFLVWTSKEVGLLCCLCVAFQQFYLAIADVDAANAIKLHEKDLSVEVRRLSKRVTRLNASWGAAGGARAGGVFRVDATLPLRLLQLLASYTAVLLQFAFL